MFNKLVVSVKNAMLMLAVALGSAVGPLSRGVLDNRPPKFKLVDDGRGPKHLQSKIMTAAEEKRERRRLRNLEVESNKVSK